VRFIKDSIATGVWAADDSATVSGRIAAVVVDPSDPVGGVYNHPDLYKNIWINQSELESVIDSLARDVASHCGSRSSGELASFLAFPGFTGGVSVAAGDVNGDKIDDIIIAAGPGAGPHVK